MTFLLTAGSAYLVGYMFVYAAEHAMLRRDAEEMDRKMKALLRLKQGLEKRRTELRGEVTRIEVEHKRGNRQQFLAMKKALDLEDRRGTLVRSLGEEELRKSGKPVNKYVAKVWNESVTKAVAQQSHHASLSNDWSQPQPVEIWATNAADARALVEKFYPSSQGFSMMSLAEADVAEPEPVIVPQKAVAS
jgi:hypothetical protein